MKKIIVYFLVLSLGFFIGCTKFEEYKSVEVLTKPATTLSVSNVADSSFTMDFSTDKAGLVGFVVLNDTSVNVATISILSHSLEDNDATLMLNTYSTDGPGGASLDILGLMPNTYYKVAVAASNIDGVESDVENFILKTDDGIGPSLFSISPERSLDPVQATDFEVVLEFDEPIGSVDASKFSFSYYLDGVEEVANTAVIDPDDPFKVVVSQSIEAHAGDYVFLSYQEGAVKDLSGNPVAERVSGVIDGSVVGLYWRAENIAWDIDLSTILPENGSAVSDAEFYVQFKTPFAVYNNAEDGDVRFIVKSVGKTTIYDVPADNIVIDEADSTVVVYKPFVPTYGEMVYFEMDAGVLIDDYDNPNSVIESGMDGIANPDDPINTIGWLISYGYTRDMVLGTYTFDGVSYWEGADESFDVEIVADPEDESMVIINGFYGSETPIPAIFNGDFATLTIIAETDYLLGDLFDDGGETYFWSYDEDKIVINISPNGDMVTDPYYWLALYWVAADGSDEGYVNMFIESTWTKQVNDAFVASEKSSRLVSVKKDTPRYGIVK